MGIQLSIPIEEDGSLKNKPLENHLQIDFSQNWNNKLNNQVFSTIRPKQKNYSINQKYAVYLNETFFCYAKPIFIKIMSLEDLIAGNYHLLDTGMEESEFMELILGFYGKKTWWKEKQTNMNFILFKKIEQLNLFE